MSIDIVNGKPLLVEGHAKLRQDLIEVQMDDFDQARDWGSEIEIGRLFTAIPGAEGIVQHLVTQAVDRLIAYQNRDPFIPPDEAIERIVDVFVLRQGDLNFWYLLIVESKQQTVATEAMQVQVNQQTALTRLFEVSV